MSTRTHCEKKINRGMTGGEHKIDTNEIKEDLSAIFTLDNMEKCMKNSKRISQLSVEDMLRPFTI